jgi:hypothetical protein
VKVWECARGGERHVMGPRTSGRLRTSGAVVIVCAGLTLSACGTAPPPHAVPRTPAPPVGVVAPAPLNDQTLSQIDAVLGAVHNDLGQASTDLSSPKPDS